ncbi:MAG: diadenylate cyclase [Polyangiaceae bacterium]|nr:diadenylate cyclase [Polyangiaceae bacterium]
MSFTELVTSVRSQLRLADVVDVLVVTVVLYGAIAWFRTAQSRFVLAGLSMLAALYFVARVLELHLTLVLFQAGITVALLALVVIFQEDMRRVFERIGTSGPLPPRAADKSDAADLLVEALATLTRSRTGALVVLKGREPLDRHVTGGIRLDGKLSAPLLCSIFDTSSAGHDGAVIIQDGRVQAFGVHLPLSNRVTGQEPFGTRHTAALGLSERSDAQVLVVSEERGKVSIAQNGKLDVVEGAAELKWRVTAFLAALSPRPRASRWKRALSRNVGAKLLALGIATGTWLAVVGYQGEVEARTFTVPVTFRDLPAGVMLDQPRPTDVLVTVAGPGRAFDRLDPTSIVVAMNVNELHAGPQVVPIRGSDLNLPSNLTVHRVVPDAVTVVAHNTVSQKVSVVASTEGWLRQGLKLESVRVEPKALRLLVKRSEAGTITQLVTAPVLLSSITETTTVQREVDVPSGTRLADREPSSVRVTVQVTKLGHDGANE